LLVGLARIMQGAHFVNDILWAGGLAYLTGELLSRAFHFNLSDRLDSSKDMI